MINVYEINWYDYNQNRSNLYIITIITVKSWLGDDTAIPDDFIIYINYIIYFNSICKHHRPSVPPTQNRLYET